MFPYWPLHFWPLKWAQLILSLNKTQGKKIHSCNATNASFQIVMQQMPWFVFSPDFSRFYTLQSCVSGVYHLFVLGAHTSCDPPNTHCHCVNTGKCIYLPCTYSLSAWILKIQRSKFTHTELYIHCTHSHSITTVHIRRIHVVGRVLLHVILWKELIQVVYGCSESLPSHFSLFPLI